MVRHTHGLGFSDLPGKAAEFAKRNPFHCSNYCNGKPSSHIYKLDSDSLKFYIQAVVRAVIPDDVIAGRHLESLAYKSFIP